MKIEWVIDWATGMRRMGGGELCDGADIKWFGRRVEFYVANQEDC